MSTELTFEIQTLRKVGYKLAELGLLNERDRLMNHNQKLKMLKGELILYYDNTNTPRCKVSYSFKTKVLIITPA